jgi:hypothetical protein
MLLWLGALVFAVASFAGIVAVVQARDWWPRRTFAGKVAILGTSLLAVLLATNFLVSSVGQSEEACVVEGQVFDIDGSPVRGASLVARPVSGFEDSKIDSYFEARIAETDLEGRFRADCSMRPQPYFIAVNLQQYES